MELHPFKPYPAGHVFASCVQCGRPKTHNSHNDTPDPLTRPADKKK